MQAETACAEVLRDLLYDDVIQATGMPYVGLWFMTEVVLTIFTQLLQSEVLPLGEAVEPCSDCAVWCGHHQHPNTIASSLLAWCRSTISCIYQSPRSTVYGQRLAGFAQQSCTPNS